MYEIQLALY